MKYYFLLYRRLVENSVSLAAQYRGDTIIKFLINFFWVGMMFLFVEILFGHAPNLAGWSKDEIYLLTFFWILVDEFMIAFFTDITKLPDVITDGDLDLFMTKPANPLFLLSLGHLDLKSFYRLLGEATLFFIWLWTTHLEFGVAKIFLAIILFFCAVITYFAMRLILNTLSFWFYRINNVNEMWQVMQTIGQYPLTILPKPLRILFLTLFPVGLSAYIPAAATLGKAPIWLIIYTLSFSLFLFGSAILLWRFALKNYTSASS